MSGNYDKGEVRGANETFTKVFVRIREGICKTQIFKFPKSIKFLRRITRHHKQVQPIFIFIDIFSW